MFTARTQVQTDKAERYLKALCNHFSRKVTATYDDRHGEVQFSIGNCQMEADANTLTIQVRAENEENLAQVKAVVADHLERFASGEGLQLTWLE